MCAEHCCEHLEHFTVVCVHLWVLLGVHLFPPLFPHVLECLFYALACSHAGASNPVWSFKVLFVVLVQSAQRGGLNCLKAVSGRDLSFGWTSYVSRWILSHASKLSGSQMALPVFAKLAERDLDPFHSTWHEHEEHAIHFCVQGMDPIVRLPKCADNTFITFAADTKIIVFFFALAIIGVTYSASVSFNPN